MKQIAAVELERCYALADLLDTVPPEDFDLRTWVLHESFPRRTRVFGLIETHPGCGFAGCAMGWAAYEEIFPGFTVRGGNIIYQRIDKCPLASWNAVRAVMGLNVNMSHYLFAPEHYKTTATATMVADRVRRFADKIAAIRARDRRKVAAPVQRKLELVA